MVLAAMDRRVARDALQRGVPRRYWLGGLPPSVAPVIGQGAVELVAGVDGELGEDFVQVVFDGARAHEQLGGDLGVGQAVTGESGDLGLADGEPGGGIGGAFAYSLAGGP